MSEATDANKGSISLPVDEPAVEAFTDELKTKYSAEAREEIVDKGFLPLALAMASRLPFVKDMLAGYYCMLDSQTPTGIKASIVIPLVYFVMPIDAIPDIIPVLGFTDDLGVWATSFKIFHSHINGDHYRLADELLGNQGPTEAGA